MPKLPHASQSPSISAKSKDIIGRNNQVPLEYVCTMKE
uniref:Uncharacterized protein n=1 Tax=Arundo donax TaxID=35708 RepID=A0A0A9CJD8_ARUDO